MSSGHYDSLLTAGAYLRKILMADPELRGHVETVTPVAFPVDLPLPYIVYGCVEAETNPVKNHYSAVSQYYQFQIFSEDYDTGLRIAARVLDVLDGFRDDRIRSCTWMTRQEMADPKIPAYIQVLQFDVRIR